MAEVLAPPTTLMRPRPLEIASGIVSGSLGSPAPLPDDGDRTGPGAFAALEQSILPALRRPPCLVSFSGGVDSSFVLTVAAQLARREGLPVPIPITWRFDDAPRAEETAWQERVIREVGIDDWRLLQATDDLDLVGPVAQQLLTRHGVLYPFNVHLHLPIITAAAGGSLLTGAGGDQVLTGRRPSARPGSIRAARARVLATPVLDSSRSRHVLARVPRRRQPNLFPWLRPARAEQVGRVWRREIRSEPRRIGDRVGWHARRRDLVMTCSSLDTIAADHGVRVTNPLLAPVFLAALGRQFSGARDLTRSELLLAIGGDALPAVATADRPKAYFAEVFLRRWTREFTRSWEGSGVDETLVDSGVLRELWSRWPIPLATAGLVQQLWLATNGPSRAWTSGPRRC